MELKIEDLSRYINGYLRIHSISNDIYVAAGIENFILEGTILKLQLLWLTKMLIEPEKKWVYSDEKEYAIDLTRCDLDSYNTIEGYKFAIRSYELEAEVSFTIPNGRENALAPMEKDMLPNTLLESLTTRKETFFSQLDLTKIPKVDFKKEAIPCEKKHEERRFVRMDVEWNNEILSFVRINPDPKSSHLAIRNSFFSEVGEQVHLSGDDIEYSLRYTSYDAGFVKLDGEDIDVYGGSTYLPHSENRSLTREILSKEFQVNVT